jgi:hypothetical protein
MKRILTAAIGTAIALSTLAMPASAEVMGTQSVTCDPNSNQVHLNVSQRENKFIDAKGGFYGCDAPNPHFTILVQLKNAIGWSDKVKREGDWPRNTLTTTTFTCTGQGTKTYRAQMFGYLNGGTEWIRNSADIKVKC